MNSFGRKFRVSVFGESHGPVVGVLIDGLPSGIELSEDDFIEDINRRKSGGKGTTRRMESDKPVFLSGVYQGHTTGAPLTIIFENKDTRSKDYAGFGDIPRPGHVDYVSAVKWDDCNDPRGGGHFSGRLTLPIVAAGVVAKKVLSDFSLFDDVRMDRSSIKAELIEVGGIQGRIQDGDYPVEWTELLTKIEGEGDSVGAVVECRADIACGYGEPFWDGIESLISHAIFAIPGVRGIEFGDGFGSARMYGSEHNDPIGENGIPLKNGAGGVNGGLSNGNPIVFRVAFKPTSSIAKEQETWNFSENKMDVLKIDGRHDVCFALRAPVIVEAMTAIVLADMY